MCSSVLSNLQSESACTQSQELNRVSACVDSHEQVDLCCRLQAFTACETCLWNARVLVCCQILLTARA